MPTTALPEISELCKRCIGPWGAIGARCFALVVGQGALPGRASTRSRHGPRCCDQSCSSLTGSYRLSQCCKPTAEERRPAQLHDTCCGSGGWATASGDPVGGQQ